jgi:hypothetical protein
VVTIKKFRLCHTHHAIRFQLRFLRIVYGVALLWFAGTFMSACGPGKSGSLAGTVLDEAGPVPGAVVRVQASTNSTISAEDGSFTLVDIPRNEAVTITAWAPGYYIIGEQTEAGDKDVEIHLQPHAASDNPDYEWLPSQYHPGLGENQGCAECHSSVSAELGYTLPVDEWLLDAHAQTATNPRFLTMYTGTDIVGNQSPQTRYGSNRDYGTFPLRPDPNQPYFGPGYKLDFPDTMGNCAACHTPAASVNNPYGVDPNQVSGVPAEGIPCDFCHKIWDVRLDKTTGRPFANMPGVLSFVFHRPPEGHQFFAGPFDDVAPGEDTYSPLQQQSQICAPCHFGVFWDTLIYNSFGEWLESAYSDPETGQTCQSCHMPPLGNTHFALPQAGGLDRDPATIYSHRMPGAADEALLQNAVSMAVEPVFQDERLVVNVTLTNDKTGHHVPTDSPLRQMILLVNATDLAGNSLHQVGGPVVPDWGGVGDPQDGLAQRIANGYYAGVPGTAFAKILIELWTEVSPSGAYWNPTRILSDNRIAAMESDTTTYSFEIPEGSPPPEILVSVKLLFRRAFIDLMDQKGWEVPDILMEAVQIDLSGK